jgi:hypothetical protein
MFLLAALRGSFLQKVKEGTVDSAAVLCAQTTSEP